MSKLSRHFLPAFCVLLMVFVLSFQITVAQDDDALPPHVIDVLPLPGVEHGLDEPLTIFFDQPMQIDGVSLHFEPTLTGSLTWLDARTLEFLPDDDLWPTNQRYAVTINGEAINRLELEPAYEFEVQSPRSLSVAAVTPEDGTQGVDTESAQISVTFDRPVVPLVSTVDQGTLPAPMTLSPQVAGTGEWVNSSVYVFRPSSAFLAGDTQFTATVNAGLTAVDGTVLSESFRWSFRTLAPQVIGVEATEVFDDRVLLLNTGFAIEFSQPMDRAATEAAFTLLGQAASRNQATNSEDWTDVAGQFQWDAQSRTMTFQPTARLKVDHTYRVILDETARSATGSAVLLRPIDERFWTVGLPRPQMTFPSSTRTMRPGVRRVEFSFNTAMNTNTFEDRYLISPEPAGEVTPYVYDDHTFALGFEQEDDVTYNVTLLAGIEDMFGNVTENDYVFTYTVRDNNAPTRASASLLINSEFSLANVNNDEIHVPVRVYVNPSVTFSIFRTDLETVTAMDYSWSEYYNQYFSRDTLYNHYDEDGVWQPTTPAWVQPENLLHTWTDTYEGADRGTTIHIPLTLANGDPLPIGMYGVEMTAPDSSDGRETKSGFLLAVTNASITIKKSTGETLAWVTDIASTEPIPDVTIDIWDNSGTSIMHGQTDADGIYQLSNSQPMTFVLAESDDAFGVWFNNATPSRAAFESYLYTDRPIYRPGETVYFRGVLRDKDDVTYTVPDVNHVQATARFGYGYGYDQDDTMLPIYDAELSVMTDFGTFSGSFEIPDDTQLGYYNLRTEPLCALDERVCGASDVIRFEVAEFRVPEYEVSVTAQNSEIIQGEPLNTLVQSNYYFGAPVSNADLVWRVRSNYTARFSYAGSERGFRFGDNNFGSALRDNPQAQQQSDSQGRYLVEEAVALNVFRPVSVVVEATVTDESNQPISARTNVLVHPSEVYVGLRTARTFNTIDQPVMIDVLTVTPDSVLQPNQMVDLDIIERRWVRTEIQFGQYEWNMEEIPVTTTSVTTGNDGLVSYPLQPPNSGIFDVTAATFDAQGRESRSELRVYVRDDAPGAARQRWGDPFDYFYSCGFGTEFRRLRLVADQDSYVPGDVAEVLIPNPFDEPITALITVERAGVMQRDVRQIVDDSLIYQLPLTDDHAPTAYVNVLLLRGTSADNPNPDSVRGDIRLNIEPVNRRLTVELESIAAQVAPGDEASFNVRLTDSRGDPVVGEVGLALTDEAALALRPANSGTLEDAFYNVQSLRVNTSVSLRALLTVPANTTDGGCGGGGGGGGNAGATIRDDFEYTPLWSPHVVTDADGRATVSVEMPDNLTRWRLDARAVTTDTLVGQHQINIVSTLPLLIRPSVPRFFVVGDQLPLAAVINNNTDQMQIVTARIEATGVMLGTDAEVAGLQIAPGGRARVEWPVTIQDIDGVDVTMFVSSESGLQDAAKPALRTGPNDTIPVLRYIAPDTVATGGVLLDAGSRTEGISLPPRFADVEGTLTVQLDPSIAASTIDSLDYLRNFPHQCVEQTVSRFYPNAVTYNALRSLNIDDPVLRENLETALDAGYSILETGQNDDGGWGWFTHMDSHPYVTAYALLGLYEARRTGFEVDQEMLTRALSYASGEVRTPNLRLAGWALNRQAFLLYVLGLYGEAEQSQLDDLYEFRLKMSLAARSHLLMAYHEIAPDAEQVAALSSDLTSAAILSANGAHWEEEDTDWYNWGSDTRTTAMALSALGRVQPDQLLLPNVVRWLMIARRGDHWQTTQETAWAVIALTEWMLHTGELQGDYNFTVRLNGADVIERDVLPESVRNGETLQLEVNDLLRDEINRLTVSRDAGEGALYYSALMNLELPADEVRAVSRGVRVERQYFIGNDRRSVDSAQVGDTVTVRLTINVPQDVYFFALEDVIPAGIEVIDQNLLTASRAGDEPRLQRLYTSDPYWYWRWWYFDRTELRDEGAVLYADFLPQGSYVYTYQAVATTPGAFQVLPAQGYAFYQPDVFGRTDGAMFEVRP